ncbi:MAG TPA: VTT domain-containing protein [Terriglobia bacterium]|nr:VTT domain-containing protein [Terriglobia bacterium]
MLNLHDLAFTFLFSFTAHIQAAIRQLFRVLVHLGGFGLLILSFVDSSPMYVPFGNDLLMIAMSARRHELFVYYAVMVTAGSVLGSLTVDLLARKEGEKGLERLVPRRRLDYVKGKIRKDAAWALAFASLVPPPFPFTGFVAAAAALDYPRKRLLTVIALSRFARYLIEGALGIFFGRRLLGLIKSPVLVYAVVALIVISIAGSILAVLSLVRRSRTAPPRTA